MRTRILGFFLITSIFGCKAREEEKPSELFTKDPTALIHKIGVSMDNIGTKPLPLSIIWQELSPQEKKAFIALLVKKFQEMLGNSAATVGISETEFFDKNLGVKLSELRVLSAEVLADRIIQKIEEANALKYIDFFPSVPLSLIPKAQEIIFNLPANSETATNPMFKSKDLPYLLKEKSCEGTPAVQHFPIAGLSRVFRSLYPIDDITNKCYHENNIALSEVINILSENTMPNHISQNISLQIVKEDGTELNETVKDFPGLINILQKAGYTVEIYGTRVIVDFLAFTYKDKKDVHHPMRLPTWFVVDRNGEAAPVLGEHGELGLLIHKNDGLRLAESRYFLGVPDASTPGVVSKWQPNYEKRADWHGVKHDLYGVYRGESMPALENWFSSVAKVMYAFQTTQSIYKLPINSYGFFVCSDSLALVLANYQYRFHHTERLSQSFPLVRANKVVRHSTGEEIFFTKVLAELSDVPYEFILREYPSDTSADIDIVTRMNKAFPLSDRRRFSPNFDADFIPVMEKYFWYGEKN